jgi:hypothetical protein
MTQVLVVAPHAEMRSRIAAGLEGIDCPLVTVPLRSDAARMFDNLRQVLVYAAHQGGDAAWLAGEMEEHPELRVVYLSPQPWSSLNYNRARCMIAPHRPDALDTGLLRRMVLELLSPA